MFFPNIKQGLTRQDFYYLMAIAGVESRDNRGKGQEKEPDLNFLLDSPGLVDNLKHFPVRYEVALLIWVHHYCRLAGVEDAAVRDYVASMLAAFGAGKRAYKIAQVDDDEFSGLYEVWKLSRESDPRRAFMAQAHMGNYALWLAGIFPDRIEQRRWRSGGPGLAYFDQMGRSGWEQAGMHKMAAEANVEDIFKKGAEDFVRLRMALNNLSDSIFWPRIHSPEKLIRQVESAMGQLDMR